MLCVYDEGPVNPSFEKDLKAIAKKEKQITEIYTKNIVHFLLCCLRLGVEKTNLCCKKRQSVTAPIIVRSKCFTGKADATLIKFRVKLPDKGISAGGRMSVALVGPFKGVVPIEIYTHGGRGNSDDTEESILKAQFNSGKINKGLDSMSRASFVFGWRGGKSWRRPQRLPGGGG